MAIAMAKNTVKGYKIDRGGFRPRKLVKWLLLLVVFAAAALVAAYGWQQHQIAAPPGAGAGPAQAPDSAAPPPDAQAVNAQPAPTPTPTPSPSSQESAPIIVSSSRPEEGAHSSSQAAAQPDYSVPFQVPAAEPVDDSYFDDALFVGDSITTGISIYGAMANATVVASTGINPSTILTKAVMRDEAGELHTVLETMAGYSPAKIYVLLGANGVGWIEEDAFIAYYDELIGKIKAQHPGAIIYVQSIFPVTLEKSLSENGIYANEKIDQYNQALGELCEKDGLYYLNVAEALRGPDGALPAEASTDGIHITPEYYSKWFQYLRTHTVHPPAAPQ